MKIRPVEAELFHAGGQTDRQTEADRRTDMMKLIVHFHSFANAPKIPSWCLNMTL